MDNDEEYGRHLGARLHGEVEQVRAAPDLARRLRQRQARRTWAWRTAIAVPVAAAAVAAGVLVTGGVGAPGPTQQANNVPPTDPQLQNVAYVQAQTIKALTQASDYVIYEKNAYGRSYYEVWTDRATQRSRSDSYGPPSIVEGSGRIASDGRGIAPPAPGEEGWPGPIALRGSNSVSGPDGNQDLVFVDYERRTWSKMHNTERRPPLVVPDPTEPDTVRAAVDAGTLELLGPETVGGVATLHLRMFAVQRGYQIDMWVDQQTFLPVQETSTVIGGEVTPAITTTYSWLPRTEENLARLVLTPPPDFLHIP